MSKHDFISLTETIGEYENKLFMRRSSVKAIQPALQFKEGKWVEIGTRVFLSDFGNWFAVSESFETVKAMLYGEESEK